MKTLAVAVITTGLALAFSSQCPTQAGYETVSANVTTTNRLATSVPKSEKTRSPKVIKLNDATMEGKTDDGFNLTFVTSTGLAWLDATISKDHSTDQIRKRIADPNDDLYGLRYANQEEIDTLLESYGLPGNGEVDGTAALAFIGDFGQTDTTEPGPCTSPVWPVSDELNQYKQVIAHTNENKSSVAQGGIDPNSKQCHFLVVGRTFVNHHDPAIEGVTADGNNLTFDTRTRFSWLDATISKGHTTNEIQSRIAKREDSFYGFRYANQDEVDALLKGYGLPGNGEISGAAAAAAFIKDFGQTDTTEPGPCTVSVWPVSDELNQYKQVITHTEVGNSSVSQGGIDPDAAECHFLIDARVFFGLNDPSIQGETADGNNLTFDTRTGLVWLDASITAGSSTQEIRERLQNKADELYGFRYGDQEDIDDLLAGYGLPGNGEVPKASLAAAFMLNFGKLSRTMPGPATSAMWPVSDELSQSKQIISHTEADKSSVSQGGIAPDTTSPAIGHFLTKRR